MKKTFPIRRMFPKQNTSSILEWNEVKPEVKPGSQFTILSGTFFTFCVFLVGTFVQYLIKKNQKEQTNWKIY